MFELILKDGEQKVYGIRANNIPKMLYRMTKFIRNKYQINR
jgi:hypothetical protein